MKVKVLVTQLCLTLCDPMDCSQPGSTIHGIFQARILEWVAISLTLKLLLGQEDPLEKEMEIHPSTIAWKIPWTEELGWLQSMGSQRVGHD